MKQAIGLAYARMQESRAGDCWRATAVVVDLVTPIVLTASCVVAMFYLVIGHLS